MMQIFLYLCCLLLILYKFYAKNFDYWKSKGVPYVKPTPIFGNFYKVIIQRQHIFYRIREIYNSFKTPYVGFYIFNQPTLIIRSPELLKKVLIKDQDIFLNRKIALNEAIDPVATHTLFSSQGKIWKTLRTNISPIFTSRKLKFLVPSIQECASDLTNYLDKHNGGTVELKTVAKKYTVDILSWFAFGIKSSCLKDEDSQMMKVSSRLFDVQSFIRSFAMFSYFFAPKFIHIFRLTFADKPSVRYLVNIFNHSLKEREDKNILCDDLVQLLNDLKKNVSVNENYKFDQVKIGAQAVAFFTTGHDTTCLALMYALYELALHQDIQDRLRQEIVEAFAKHGEFNYEVVNEMKYMDMVFNETLRKYPLTSILNRKTERKYTFEDTGLTIDKDVQVLIPVAGIHLDPEYFPNPEKFDPERFSDANRHKILPYTFLPFGIGPRNCIGQKLGTLAGKIALAYCLKDFVLERTEATEVPLEIEAGTLFISPNTKVYVKVTKI